MCAYPYLLPPDLKRMLLQEVEARIHMSMAARDGITEAAQNIGASHGMPFGGLGALLFGGGNEMRAALSRAQFFVLRVRRQNLLQDCMQQISTTLLARPQDVRKPLRVVFNGEEGLDGGGLRKEFFQLLVEEIFNPSRGMFSYNESTRLYYFAGGTFEPPESFAIIGTLIGIAIYNSVLLDLHFPLVLYKLLLGMDITEKDLAEQEPDLARTLANLRDYGPGLEEDLQLTFEIDEVGLFGSHSTHELCIGGSQKHVTNDNVDDYITRYVQRKLVGRHAAQIKAFKDGFYYVISGPALELFRPEELRVLVVGIDELDFSALEKSATYEGGYSPDHPTVKAFWRCLNSMSKEETIEFLRFTTGCSRAPLAALESWTSNFSALDRWGELTNCAYML